MKISVISPSYNQAQFLPDNLRTVSAQKGVTVEHIIIDPGSTDGSTELARAATHAILVNEPDRGQSHGITKGYAMATGDVIVWLNSDDFYPSDDTLAKVARAFEANPDADVIYGNVNFVDEEGKFLRSGYVNKDSANLLKSFNYQVGIVQPGVFMKKKVFDAVGGPSEDYNYCMDYEYWVRIAAAGFKWVFLDEVLAHHRWWAGMKTSSGRGDSLIEHFKVGMTYFGYIHHKWLDRYGEFLATNSDGVVNHAKTVDAAAKRVRVRRAIERFVTQDMLATLEKSDEKEKVDTLAYIRAQAPDLKRSFFDTAELVGAKSVHPDPMAEKRVAWHVFNTTTSDKKTFKTYTVPANFSRSFSTDWYYDQHARAVENLERMSRQRKDVCVVVANGPSLNHANFDHLEHADVIISNYAIISKALARRATYLTVVNDLVAKQGATQFNALDIPKVVPFWLANSINPTETTFFVPATVEPEFNTELGGNFSWRSTVSFLNMQLAYALGYERVVLIGFDHSYQQAVELKEGAAVDQKTEDPNHFDPRYFQGKIWQAADTGNMEKMYLVAREAFAKGGRSIINATVGGKLEVFPRMSLEDALGISAPMVQVGKVPSRASVPAPVPAAAPASALRLRPRTLVIDMTPMGNGTATGEIKSNLLKGWPQDALLQIGRKDAKTFAKVTPDGEGFAQSPLPPEKAKAVIDTFAPEVILFRPVAETPDLNTLAIETARRLGIPMVTWIMDDWPARLEAEDPAKWATTGPALTAALDSSALCLSISDAMSKAFYSRYGKPFVALANGVDPDDWPTLARPARSTFVVRYAGGIAPDMNRASLLRVAQAVDVLAKQGVDIRFEISTQKWWLEQCKDLFAAFPTTTLELADKTASEYRRWIGEADLLLIAYNFDEQSLKYVQYSIANKMPECLASGVPVLIHGPKRAATVAYLSDGLAQVVAEPDVTALVTAIKDLQASPKRRAELAAAGRARAVDRHNIHKLRERLGALIAASAWANGRGVQASAPSVIPMPALSGGGGTRSSLLALTAEVLLGKRDATTFSDDPALKAMLARAEQELGTDDPAVRHLRRVETFSRRGRSG